MKMNSLKSSMKMKNNNGNNGNYKKFINYENCLEFYFREEFIKIKI